MCVDTDRMKLKSGSIALEHSQENASSFALGVETNKGFTSITCICLSLTLLGGLYAQLQPVLLQVCCCGMARASTLTL